MDPSKTSRTGWIIASLLALDPSTYLASVIGEEVTPAHQAPFAETLIEVGVEPESSFAEEKKPAPAYGKRPPVPFAPRASMVVPCRFADEDAPFPCSLQGAPFTTLFSMPIE